MNDVYDKTVRRLHGKVEMTFYESTSDEMATPALGSIKADLNGILQFVSTSILSDERVRKYGLQNLINSALVTERKYVTCDGLSFPDKTAFPMPADPYNTGVPLLSFSACGEDGAFADRPAYVLTYPEVREVCRLLIVGDEKWGQFPVEYNVNLYVPEDCGGFAESTDTFRNADYEEVTAVPQFGGLFKIGGTVYKKYTFKVSLRDGQKPVKQCLKLGYLYPAKRAELEIIKWSAPNAAAKILYFSDDVKYIFLDNELQSMSVLEEKAEKVDALSYGITSNACTVKVLNKDNRFIRSPELLKMNRIIKPYVTEEGDEKWRGLGKFFSDGWEVSSASDFVTCKAYDVLYNLQKMNICYEMTCKDGIYLIDGRLYGCNANAKAVFEKIFKLVNAQRKESGIFGSDIKVDIDPRLETVVFDYVCLGNDTAWNMLQTMANATQSFIYADREGVVRIKQDDFDEDKTTDSCVIIFPSNSFSYNLPTMSHAIVNRVTVPYITLEDVTEDKDDNFEIKEKDFEYDENGNVILNLSLKNFYTKIAEVQLGSDSYMNEGSRIPANQLEIAYNQIRIKLNRKTKETQYVQIIPGAGCRKKLTTANYVYNEKNSQKKNGVAEFELKCDKLIFGEDKAKEAAEKIVKKYGNGVPFIETEWRGSPMLELGEKLLSFSLKEPSPVAYECLSNDMSYDGGLKVKTKARKITASE